MPTTGGTHQAESFIFPVSMNQAEDLTVSRHGSGLMHESFRRAAAIAAALRARRDEYRQDGIKMEMANWPEVTLFIDWLDLDPHEEKSKRAGRLAEAMQEVCGLSGKDRARTDAFISSKLAAINKKIVAPGTGGKYRIGWRGNHIAIMETEQKTYDLKIGNKAYAVLGAMGRGGKSRAAAPYPNEILRQLAAAGLNGIRIGDIEQFKDKTESTIAVGRAKANKWFAEQGFPSLSISLIRGRLYLFDFSQPAHRERREALREEGKVVNDGASGAGARTAGERWGRANATQTHGFK